MKRTVLLTAFCFIVIVKAKSQVILNEIYTDPGAGKHEFFELYNTSGSTTPTSLDHFTIVTFFDISGKKGFYVLDMPNLTINPHGFFVGSSSIPFNYQGITNSTASDFSWNSPLLITQNGYLKKWEQGTLNLLDGNAFYDEAILPVNFNDFFYRRSGAGHSYCVFVYKNGVLVNTFIGGTGGNAAIVSTIVNMPSLHIDMLNPSSTDFNINWSIYNSIPLEYCTQDVGSDNGYIRERDGTCGMWDKSSAGVQHTPKVTNGGQADETTGTISVSSVLIKGSPATGSVVEYDVVGVGSATSFPVEMMIYLDNGTIMGKLDPADTYITSTIETMLSQGPWTTTFFPWDESILIVVKSSSGCIDKIQYLPSALVLSVKLSSFHGNVQHDKIYLGWTVMQNEAADRYIVEKSFNGKDFETEAIILASDRLGSETYGIYDNRDEASKIFYRLKIVDKEQKVEYSKVIVFEEAVTNDIPQLHIITNPVRERLTVRYNATGSETVTIKVYDLTGRMVSNHSFGVSEGTNLINVPSADLMSRGMYVAELNNGSKRYTAKFIKE